MAERNRSGKTRLLGLCLALTGLAAADAAFAQAYGPGPTYQWNGQVRGANRPRPEPYCGANQGATAPDIMSYDRKSGTEVLVGSGPSGASTSVTGVNRDSGSAFSVQGDLQHPGTPYICTADNLRQQGYAITPQPNGATVVSGYNGEANRRFEVAQGAGREGPDFKSFDPEHRSGAEVVTTPDGHTYARTFDGRRALACTRARLGLGLGVNRDGDGVALEAGPATAEVSAHRIGIDFGC